MRIKGFFTDFFGLISEPKTYARLLKKSPKHTLGFLFLSLCLISLLPIVGFYTHTAPQIKNYSLEVLDEIVKRFPDDYAVVWDGEQLQTTPESLEVPLPESLEELEGEIGDLPNIIGVINTKESQEFSPNDLSIQPLFLITNTQLWVQQLPGSYKPVALLSFLPEGELLHVDKANIAEKIDAFRYNQLDELLFSVQLFAPLAILFVFLLASVTLLLFEGLFLFIITRLYGLKITVTNALQLSALLLVPSQLVTQTVHLALPSVDFPIATVSFWAFAAYILIFNNKKLFTRRG